jgi:hypothetical protein
MMPGTPEKRTHDDARNGTTSLFAALGMASGKVIGALHRRRRSTENRKFVIRVDRAVPADLDVHVICDNCATVRLRVSSTARGDHASYESSAVVNSKRMPSVSLMTNWWAAAGAGRGEQKVLLPHARPTAGRNTDSGTPRRRGR